jgi:histidinol-phosphate phosphatase family protein
MLDLQQIDKDWSLFLDRDGVINHEKDQSYVFHYGEFLFYDNTKAALQILTEKFGPIVIVTNQRGIGKGLMTTEDLYRIHQKMVEEIVLAGGRIDNIYHSDSLLDDHPDRKPNPGMALRAQKDLPAIDFTRSVMVGNNISDMEFGKNAGMYTVFVRTTKPGQTSPHPSIDMIFNSLYDFAKALQLA